MWRCYVLVVLLLSASQSSAWGWGEIPRQSLAVPTEQAMLDKLDQTVELRLRKVPLNYLVDVCRAHGIAAQIDLKALNEVGVLPKTPISIDIAGVSLRTALRTILRDLDLTWHNRDGVLWISTPEGCDCSLSLRTYDVRDLVPVVMVDGQRQYDIDMLIELITGSVAPNTWDEVGGPASIRHYQNGEVLVLIIDQSPDVHREIDLLLWQLRQHRGRPWSMPITSRPAISAPAQPVSAPAPVKRQTRSYVEPPSWLEKAVGPSKTGRANNGRVPAAGMGLF